MKKIWNYRFLAAVSALFLLTEVSALEITKQWKIVRSPNGGEEIQAAAEQIQKYIQKSAGIRLEIVSQAKGPAVTVVRNNALAPEEWLVRAQKDSLLISGGPNGGVLFAAYEFIEKALGCLYLAPKTEYIPKVKRLTVADDLKIAGKPAFQMRRMYFGPGAHQEYMSRLRLAGGAKYRGVRSAWRYGTFGGCHTFRRYAQTFPKNRTDFLSMNEKGERVPCNDYDDMGPGQLCLTHPEVRTAVAAQMRKLILQDRAAAQKEGVPAPLMYHLSRNDVIHDCVCPSCKALLKKYNGNHSGVNLEFINDVARRIGREFPDVRIVTFAYMTDEVAPQGITPEKNVFIEIAQLGTEFTTGKRDSLRSISHPLNHRALKMIEEWNREKFPLMIWDYWTLYRNQFAFPYCGIKGIVDNLRYYNRIGIRLFFAETEILPGHTENFIDLRHYLGSKLMLDPKADEKKIIAEFMNGYFETAAKPMMEFLELLEKAVAAEKKMFGGFSSNSASYLNDDFFRKAEALLAKAEKAAAGNKAVLQRIGQERIPVDIAFARVQDRLTLKADNKMLKARLEKNLQNFTDKYCAYKPEQWRVKFKYSVNSLFDVLPLPKQFANRQGFDFFGDRFRSGQGGDVANDPEASGKVILTMPRAWVQQNPKCHQRPVQLQFYDWTKKKVLLTKVIPAKDNPKDEKFHWYYVGKSPVSPKTTLAFHWSWRLSSTLGSSAYDPTSPGDLYDIWVSLRMTGPAYVPGSKKPDTLSVDRILFLKADK